MYEFLQINDAEQLKQHLIVLEARSLDYEAWIVEAKSASGKRRLAQMKSELEAMRGRYAKIPAHLPESLTILAGLQGEERQLLSVISRMENAETFKKSIDEERKAVVSILSYRETSVSRGNEIAPKDLKRRQDGR